MPESTDFRLATMGYVQIIMRCFGDTETMRAAILDGVGVGEGDLEDPRTEMNVSQQMRQFENMNRLFGEEWVLDAPELWRPAAHGALGVAAMTAATLRGAIEAIVRYAPARAPNQRLKLARRDNAYVLRHALAAPVPEAVHKIIAQTVLLSMSSMLGMFLGSARSEVRYEFHWPRPRYGARLEEALAGDVRWDAGINSIIVPRHLLDLRSPLVDLGLHHAALEQLDQAVRSAGAPEGIKGRVERLLERSETGRLSSAVTARALGLSQRTLVRRLADADVTYRDLVDAQLKTRARRWLDSGTLSRAEISERLGFADATGFSRACRRWFRAEA